MFHFGKQVQRIHKLLDFSVINETVRTFAFDHNRQELLIIPESHPNQVQIVSLKNDNITTLENARDGEFDEIAMDSLTGNIYFAENGHGIGVCTGSVTQCKLLIPAEMPEHKFYNLIVHPRRGSLFWIQQDEEKSSVVKVAGMDGENARIVASFQQPHSITLDGDNCQQEYLYVAQNDSVVKLDLRTMERSVFRSGYLNTIFYFNCHLFYTHDTRKLWYESSEESEQISYNSMGTFEFKPGKIMRNYQLLFRDLKNLSVKFAIDIDDLKFPVKNPCIELECPHDYMCVLVENPDQTHNTAPAKCLFASRMQLIKAKQTTAEILTIDDDDEGEKSETKKRFSFGKLLAFFLLLTVFFFFVWQLFRERTRELLGFLRNYFNFIKNSLPPISSSSLFQHPIFHVDLLKRKENVSLINQQASTTTIRNTENDNNIELNSIIDLNS